MHPGGPFWAKKDLGRLVDPEGRIRRRAKTPLAVAMREFEEETGARPHGEFLPLGELVQPGRKIVTAWAVEGDFDVATLQVQHVRAGMAAEKRTQGVVSRGRSRRWFSLAEARRKILPGQSDFIDRLLATLDGE